MNHHICLLCNVNIVETKYCSPTCLLSDRDLDYRHPETYFQQDDGMGEAPVPVEVDSGE